MTMRHPPVELILFVDHTVAELGEFSSVPAAGGSHKVTCDALELVDIAASAVRAFLKSLLRIFESAVHAAVAVVIDRAVTDVVSIHQVDDVHYRLWIMCGISVDLYIEDMSATGESVVRTLDLRLVLRSTFVVDRHMVR